MGSEKRKVGRPKGTTKLEIDDSLFRDVEQLAGYGLTDLEIAHFIGIAEKTIHTWKKKFPEFKTALKKGKIKADLRIVKSLYEKAESGDITAIIYWLKNRMPESWNLIDMRKMKQNEEKLEIERERLELLKGDADEYEDSGFDDQLEKARLRAIEQRKILFESIEQKKTA